MENTITVTKSEKPLLAAIYARVSTDKQENEATIDSQIDEVTTRIKSDGNILLEENIFKDEGWSGMIFARPALDALLQKVENGTIKLVYLYDNSRLSRDYIHQEVLIREIEDYGGKIISLHDINAENNEQKMLRGMIGVFNNYERIRIAERFRRGKLYKSQNQILINGQAIYGYKYNRRTDTTHPSIELEEKEAIVVKFIREKFGVDGYSIKTLIKLLYEDKIYPRKRKRDYWTESSIKRVLNCRVYVDGKIYYNKSKAIEPVNPIKKDKYRKIKKSSREVRPIDDWIHCYTVEPITPNEELHNQILKRLAYNKKYAKKNRKYDYLLSGLIYCQCGYPRAGDGSNVGGHFYYRCSERVNKIPTEMRKCHLKGVNAEVVETMVWDELQSRLANPSLLKEHAESWLNRKNNNSGLEEEKLRLNIQIDEIDEEVTRIDTAYKEGLLDLERYKFQLDESKLRKAVFTDKLQKLENQSIRMPGVNTDRLVEEAKKVIGELEFSNKKQIIQDIIDKIIVKERSEVEVWGHIKLHLSQSLAEELGYEPECRNCRITKCRKVNAI